MSMSSSFRRISATEALQLLRSEPTARLFDVRDLQSYRSAHVDGAIHLAEDRLPVWLGRLPKDDPVIIYCYHGNASQTYAATFADFRHTRVFSVDGGHEALVAAAAGG